MSHLELDTYMSYDWTRNGKATIGPNWKRLCPPCNLEGEIGQWHNTSPLHTDIVKVDNHRAEYARVLCRMVAWEAKMVN